MTDSKEIFKRRKKIQMIVSSIAICVVILTFVTKIQAAGLVIIIGLLVFSRMNWRCPECNKYLGKELNPKHCSHCGEELR